MSINESEITWIPIDNNLRVGTIKGLIRIIEHEDRRVFLDKKRAKKLKTSMLDIFKNSFR